MSTEGNQSEGQDGGSLGESGSIESEVVGYDQVFLEEAERAVLRAKSGEVANNPRAIAGATAAAVLCAAAACEALLSEYVTRQDSARRRKQQTTLSKEDVEGIRKRRGAVTRWEALLTAVGATANLQGGEYHSLRCLFKLRNVVAHRNARAMPLGTWPECLRDCVSVIRGLKRDPPVDWTSAAYNPEVAEWAHRTADTWIVLMRSAGVVPR